MSWSFRGWLMPFLVVLFLSANLEGSRQTNTANDFRELPFMPEWHLAEKIQLKFNAYHPQGMVKIGDRLYISSVQVLKKTTRIMNWKTGRDRTAGKGIGHLFEIDTDGDLIRKMTLGERDMYHPGG